MNNAFFPTPDIPTPNDEPRPAAESTAGDQSVANADNRPPRADTYILTTPEEPVQSAQPARAPATATDIRHTFSRLGLSMVVLTLAANLGAVALSYLLAYTVPGYGTSWWENWVLSLLPLYGIALPLMILTLRGLPVAPHNTDYTYGLKRDLLEKPRFTVSNYITLLFIGFGCMYIGSYTGNIIMAVLSAITGYPYANGLISMVDESPLWITLFSTCICAPLGEEFIFRKLIIDRSRRFGDGVSILISGLFFGLFHGNLFQFFYAFLLGMVLAYIYTRTNNLWWCIGMHAIVNLMGGVIIPRLAEMLPTKADAIPTVTQSLVNLLLVVWTFGCMIAGIVLLIISVKKRKLSDGSSPLYAEMSPFGVMLNPGMLANFVLMCVMMVINLIPQY